MMENFEMVLRLIVGGQLAFWGLNGFFLWRRIPPSPAVIDNFVSACIQSRFIMPTVKIFEIIFGVLLITNIATPLALVMLSPIVFVVSGLHLLHNRRRAEVLLPLTLPFVILMGIHYQDWLKLI